MHGVNKEMRLGVGGGQGSCGKRYGGTNVLRCGAPTHF